VPFLLPIVLCAAPFVVIGIDAHATTLEVSKTGARPSLGAPTTRVWLADVVAPAWPQRGANGAVAFMTDLTLGELVTVEQVKAPDEVLTRLGDADDGRLYGRVKLGKTWLHEEVLKAGWAWVVPSRRSDAALVKLEDEARAAKRGLWADEAPVEPWRWREVLLLRDAETKVFHEGWSCPHVQRTQCRQCGGGRFGTVAEAQDAGFSPHECMTAEALQVAAAMGGGPGAVSRRGDGAPTLPPAPRRACTTDADCTLAPMTPCTCPGCGAVWRTPVRKDVARRMEANFARVTCGGVGCPACAWHEAGTKAVCVERQCAVAP
jgi:hypothetical protein